MYYLRATATTTASRLPTTQDFEDIEGLGANYTEFTIRNLGFVDVYLADKDDSGEFINTGEDITALTNYLTIPAGSEVEFTTYNLGEVYVQSRVGTVDIEVYR